MNNHVQYKQFDIAIRANLDGSPMRFDVVWPAEYSRTHDPKIKAEIIELTAKRLEMVKKGEVVETGVSSNTASRQINFSKLADEVLRQPY